MKSILVSGIFAGLFLVCAFAAASQTPSAAPSNSLPLPSTVHNLPANAAYQYEFIPKGYVWSNKPLHTTASKICQTMRDRSFSETPYGINGEQDWKSCLDIQIRSIGYMRWLENSGFKLNSKNRRSAKAYLHKTFTMGPWGGYTFAQLRQAFQAAKEQQP